MDNIEKVHIGKVPFNIENRAKTELKKYLADIRSHLDTDTADEVMHDIEARIPELLAAHHVPQDGVITHSDVVRIKKQLGEPEQFSTDHISTETGSTPKKLFRDTDSAILGGVASGIGKYFNIDAAFVRAAFFVTTFFYGFGAILYVFLWVLLPEAKTSADKLLMSGRPVTVATLQHYRSSVQKSIGGGSMFLRHLILKVVRLLSFAGTAITALLLLTGIGIFSGLFYTYPFRPIVDGYGVDYLLFGLLWLGCLCVIGLLVMLTIRIWGHRSRRLNMSALAVASLFILTIAGACTASLLVYNHFSSKYGNNKSLHALSVVNQTPATPPTALLLNAGSDINLTYVINNQPLHAAYEAYPGLGRPSINIVSNKGVLTVNADHLEQTAPSCLGDICKKIYLPIHVFLYGPALQTLNNTNGGMLTINNSDLGSTVIVHTANSSTTNINNSYVTNMSIIASSGSVVWAGSSTAQTTHVVVDTTSNVSAPATTALDATLPNTCTSPSIFSTLLSISNDPQHLTINGQPQTLEQLQQNSCVATSF